MKITSKILLLASLFVFIFRAEAQELVEKKEIAVNSIKDENGNYIPYIGIRAVYIFAPLEFKSEKEKRKYDKLVRNFKKVYPFARFARMKFAQINYDISQMKTEEERQKYIETIDKSLKVQFKAPLEDLTVSQGKLLIKLIDRETGNTTFEVVKQLKGTFTAFVYQSIARIFGTSLKQEYDSDGVDKHLERLVVLYETGQL